ncbi:MAG: WD40 repeat domain-containing protein [Anaerolineae bacterium]
MTLDGGHHNEIALTYWEDRSIRIIDAATGNEKFELKTIATIGSINDISWSFDGSYLAAAIRDPEPMIAIWRFNEQGFDEVATLHDTGKWEKLSWGNNYKLYSAGAFGQQQDERKVFVWDSVSKKRQLLFDRESVITTLFASPAGEFLATFTGLDEAKLQVRNSETMQVELDFPKPNNLRLARCVVWNANATMLWGAACEPVVGTCTLWQVGYR